MIIIDEDDEEQLLKNFVNAIIAATFAGTSELAIRALAQAGGSERRHPRSVSPMGDPFRAGPASDHIESRAALA
jgi:hypothetical protein